MFLISDLTGIIPGVSSSQRLRLVAAAIFSLFLATSVPGHAEDSKPFRTARLTYLSGDVRVTQGGTSSAAKAVQNLPLVEGSTLSTGDDGQAEIEFEDGSLLRLTPHTGASLVNLSIDSSGDYNSHVSILGGLAYAELRGGTKFHYVVDAGGDEITPIENTTVRIDFDQPPAVISILDGTAHLVASSGSDVSATAGQTVTTGDPEDGGAYSVREIVAPDSWDQWNLDRDAETENEAPAEIDIRSKYAGDQGYGWSDLDANGDWYDVPGQGEVWQPDAAMQPPSDGGEDVGAQSAFDPYGNGNWAYTPAGYVWASGYGWGWLPYRCGNWNYWDGFGWGWSPGANCGVAGFDGYGNGGIYIGRIPGTYRRPGRPIPHPGPVHPILHGRGAPVPVRSVDRQIIGTGERVIGGVIVTPLPRAAGLTGGGNYARVPRSGNLQPGFSQSGPSQSGPSQSELPQAGIPQSGTHHSMISGAGLRRDYPANGTTRAPSGGIQPAYGHAIGQPAQSYEGARQPVSVQRPGYYEPSSRGTLSSPPIRSAPVAQPRPSAPASAPRSAPAPASHPAAAASPHGK